MVGKRVRAVVAAFILVALAEAPGPASANGWEHGAVPHQILIEALSLKSARIREQAAHSMGFRGQPEAVGPLVERLALPEPDGGVRQAIYVALGQLGESEALPALAACLAEAGAAPPTVHAIGLAFKRPDHTPATSVSPPYAATCLQH